MFVVVIFFLIYGVEVFFKVSKLVIVSDVTNFHVSKGNVCYVL